MRDTYGPNGFYREFKGSMQQPALSVRVVTLATSGRKDVVLDLSGSYGWYDFSGNP